MTEKHEKLWGWMVTQGDTHILFSNDKSCLNVRNYILDTVDKMMSKRPFEKITIEWRSG